MNDRLLADLAATLSANDAARRAAEARLNAIEGVPGGPAQRLSDFVTIAMAGGSAAVVSVWQLPWPPRGCVRALKCDLLCL